jgi:hypothetical protein
LIAAGLTDHLLQSSRAKIVEQALLDQLLQELKLGSSNLADRNTALALGKILAGRLILFSRIIYTGPETHVAMRLIESETGRVTAAFSETIGSASPVSALTGKLAEKLIGELKLHFPLRGKILNQEGQMVKMNIGKSVGIEMGQRFTVLNENIDLEVVATQEDTCSAKVLNAETSLNAGQLVEAN